MNSKVLSLGFQHVMAMYAGAILVPLLVGRALQLNAEQLASVLRIIVSDGVITGSLTVIFMNLFFNFRTVLAPASLQHEEADTAYIS